MKLKKITNSIIILLAFSIGKLKASDSSKRKQISSNITENSEEFSPSTKKRRIDEKGLSVSATIYDVATQNSNALEQIKQSEQCVTNNSDPRLRASEHYRSLTFKAAQNLSTLLNADVDPCSLVVVNGAQTSASYKKYSSLEPSSTNQIPLTSLLKAVIVNQKELENMPFSFQNFAIHHEIAHFACNHHGHHLSELTDLDKKIYFSHQCELEADMTAAQAMKCYTCALESAKVFNDMDNNTSKSFEIFLETSGIQLTKLFKSLSEISPKFCATHPLNLQRAIGLILVSRGICKFCPKHSPEIDNNKSTELNNRLANKPQP